MNSRWKPKSECRTDNLLNWSEIWSQQQKKIKFLSTRPIRRNFNKQRSLGKRVSHIFPRLASLTQVSQVSQVSRLFNCFPLNEEKERDKLFFPIVYWYLSQFNGRMFDYNNRFEKSVGNIVNFIGSLMASSYIAILALTTSSKTCRLATEPFYNRIAQLVCVKINLNKNVPSLCGMLWREFQM